MESCRHLAELPGFPVESPLPHLTTTNNPPTEDEIGIVHAVLEADKIATDQIDKLLDDLFKLQKIVQSRRMDYTQRTEQHKQILKPHRFLSSDVLCEIFQHLLFDARETFGLPTSPYIVLGKVCHRWRNILLSNPRLWTMFPEFNLNAYRTRRVTFVSMLETALQLSRSAALNVEIRCEPTNHGSHPALTALLPSSGRYRRLSLSVFFHQLCQFASIRGKLGDLRSLDLHIRRAGGFSDSESIYSLNLFDDTPNLQNLTVDSPSPKPLCEWLTVPWPQLVRFSGRRIKPIDVITLLTHATSLEDCTFYFAFPTLVFLPSITHHRLVKLRLYPEEGVDEESFPLDVLNLLTLPSLLEFTIKDIVPQTDILVNLITRSRCVLTFVDLETSTSDDICSFLDVISAVRTLCIVPTEALIRLLSQNRTERPVLPQLRHLMFYSTTYIAAEIIAWIPLARAMQPMVVPLVTFIITKVNLRRSHYEAYYNQLERWPGLDTWVAHFPVYARWINFIKSRSFENDCQYQTHQMIMAKYLTEIENLGEPHPRYLYARVDDFAIHNASVSNDDKAR